MKQIRHFFSAAALTVALTLAAALPAFAADYNTTLEQISRLQQLAEEYREENPSAKDPLILTLDYIRAAKYNSTIWQLVAGVPDEDFTVYVTQQDGGLAALQQLDNITVPGLEQEMDFQHLLASLTMSYQGIYIAGSWGGDCMELAEQIGGDLDACYAAAAELFNVESSRASFFSREDLRADMDAVNIGNLLQEGEDLAGTIRTYYADCTEFSRAEAFVASQFGSVDTGDREQFRQTVHKTLTSDSAMQILLYFSGHWDEAEWAIAEDFSTPLTASCYVLADHLSEVLGGAAVEGTRNIHGLGTPLTGVAGTLGGQALDKLENELDGVSSLVQDKLLDRISSRTGIPAGLILPLCAVSAVSFVLLIFMLNLAAFLVARKKRAAYLREVAESVPDGGVREKAGRKASARKKRKPVSSRPREERRSRAAVQKDPPVSAGRPDGPRSKTSSPPAAPADLYDQPFSPAGRPDAPTVPSLDPAPHLPERITRTRRQAPAELDEDFSQHLM